MENKTSANIAKKKSVGNIVLQAAASAVLVIAMFIATTLCLFLDYRFDNILVRASYYVAPLLLPCILLLIYAKKKYRWLLIASTLLIVVFILVKLFPSSGPGVDLSPMFDFLRKTM